jgi:hypothetical protein
LTESVAKRINGHSQKQKHFSPGESPDVRKIAGMNPRAWMSGRFVLGCLGLELAFRCMGQDAPTANAGNPAVPSAPVIMTRFEDERIWGTVSLETNDDGSIDSVTNQAYIELGTGICHADPVTGQLVDSVEEIDPVPGGAQGEIPGPPAARSRSIPVMEKFSRPAFSGWLTTIWLPTRMLRFPGRRIATERFCLLRKLFTLRRLQTSAPMFFTPIRLPD